MHRFLIQTVVLLAISYPAALSAELSLQVLDPHELPVPGAVVEILNPSPGSPLFSVVTDDTGCAEISLVLPATLRVKAPGFEPLDHKVGETTDTQVKLRLVPAILRTTIEVTVKDEQTPDTVTESSAFVIERNGARTVYDAVDKLVPSAYVPSRGVLGHGLGISNSISIRGLGGSPTTQLLVVIDGRPEVMGLMGHPIPDFYSLTDVGSVAITTAPASVLYGNRAMGGAIEIKPTQPQQGFHTELTVGLGSFYTGQDRLSHSGQLDRFYYKVAGGIEHTNGHRPNSSFRNQDGALHLSYNLSPAWTANVDGLYGHFNVEDPGTVQAPTPGHWSRVGRGGYSVGLQNRREQSWGSMLFFSSHGHHMLYDGFRSVDSNTGFRIHETFLPARNVEIDFGADAARYGGRARNISTGVDFGEYHVSEGGGFTRGRWTIARRLQVNAGFRYDHNSVFGGVTATEFGASYRFSDDYALSLAIGKGFRNPTIRELYLFPAPTPTLQPERLWNYQATFQMHPVARLLAWRHLEILPA